ncbi:MAG TPA: DUF2889 domain-containing protein [Blastocatellia bacterium]|nr:DUF2889 domain-containing protein [Blastocatellia bacterium]
MPAFSRTIKVDIDWVDKGAFEIHGTLDDNVHSLDARLQVAYPDFIILSATAELTRMPYPGFCTGSVGVLAKLVGERIGRGFRKRAGEVLGGAESYNHLHTLVNDMAACAFQMNYVAAKQGAEKQGAEKQGAAKQNQAALELMRAEENDHSGRRQMVLAWMPQLRNSCYTFSEKNDALFETSEKERENEL